MSDIAFHRFIEERAGNPEGLLERIHALESVGDFFDLVSTLFTEGGYETSNTEPSDVRKKRPRTARAFFQEDKIGEVKEANPGFSFAEIRAEISRMWKEDFSEKASRAEWQEKADAAKATSSPQPSPTKVTPEKQPATRKVPRTKSPVPRGKQIGRRSDCNQYVPKKAQSAYMFMCDAHRSTVSDRIGGDTKEITKELRRMWKEDFPTNESRAEYQALADQDKARFLEETATSESPSDSPPSSGSFVKNGSMSTEKGSKVWSITVEGCDIICSWGKTGGSQQTRTVTLKDSKSALAEAQKRLEKKEKEGYNFDESPPSSSETTTISESQKRKAKTKFRKSLTASLQESQPGLSKSEMSTILANSWEALSDKDILDLLQQD